MTFFACEDAFALIYWLQATAMENIDDDVPEEVD